LQKVGKKESEEIGRNVSRKWRRGQANKKEKKDGLGPWLRW
jgi:hypothetical protein